MYSVGEIKVDYKQDYIHYLQSSVSELDEMLQEAMLMIADDRKRITELESKLEDFNESLENIPDNTSLDDSIARAEHLYLELKQRGFMKTRDVLNFLDLEYHNQARRAMQKCADLYEDVEITKSSRRNTIIKIGGL